MVGDVVAVWGLRGGASKQANKHKEERLVVGTFKYTQRRNASCEFWHLIKGRKE
jgi:hypothetical protein